MLELSPLLHPFHFLCLVLAFSFLLFILEREGEGNEGSVSGAKGQCLGSGP
jgi:hypothetical protein